MEKLTEKIKETHVHNIARGASRLCNYLDTHVCAGAGEHANARELSFKLLRSVCCRRVLLFFHMAIGHEQRSIAGCAVEGC